MNCVEEERRMFLFISQPIMNDEEEIGFYLFAFISQPIMNWNEEELIGIEYYFTTLPQVYQWFGDEMNSFFTSNHFKSGLDCR